MTELNRLADMDFSLSNILVREEFWPPSVSYDYSARGRSQNLIHIITEGIRIYRTGAGTIRMSAGELLFIPDGTRYYTVGQGRCSGIGICFDLSTPRGSLSVKPDVYHCWPDKCGEYLSLIREMNTGFALGRNGTLHVKALLWLLLDKMITDMANLPEVERMIAPALRYLKLYYRVTEPVSVYAGICGLSESHFRRKFQEYMGMSPLEYRDSLRFEEARRLYSGGMTIAEAAEAVGFCDASYLRRLYKKRTGMSFRDAPSADFT